MLEGLTFLSPWLLGALAVVPVLWWLLRVMPPRPKIVKSSAFFFIKNLKTHLKSAAHTPWWLLLLRSLVVILFIIAFADPVLHPAEKLPGNKDENVLIVMDNGWASASHWQARQDKLKEYLRRIGRDGRPVILLPTAASAEDAQVHAYGPMPAGKAEELADRLKPQPWPAAYSDVLAEMQKNQRGYAVFLSDGLDATPDLLKMMQVVVADDAVNDPYILRQTEGGFSLERLRADNKDEPLRMLAYADDGSVVDELKINFPAGKTEYAFKWDMTAEMRNRTARLALHDPLMASGAVLANAGWRQHPVGLVANAAQKESRDFLSEIYYLRRALEGGGTFTIDTPEALLKQSFAALILPDSTPLTSTEKAQLLDWVEQGGFLIRFAGPNLAGNTEDDLLPVPLRDGQRSMEGAMTWEKPVRLAAISEQSPLFGLSVPRDVTVARQVLAEPTPEAFEKTWLQLEDGTPLVTGGKKGKGTIVLIHTSAGPDWSNFCYSGLYVEMLQRMTALSNGIGDYKPQTALSPLLLMDGFGATSPPDARTIAAAVKPDDVFVPSPQMPPGVYGTRQEFKPFNLGDALPKMKPLVTEGPAEPYQGAAGEVDLKPDFIKAALLLLLLDTLAVFRMRGVIFALAMIFLTASPAAAVEEKDLVSGVYLAYIKTGDADIDRISANGLMGLGQTVSNRTTVRIKGVKAVNPEEDALAYYPVIYWPMTEGQALLSPAAAGNIQNYLSQGGMILFDTRDRQFGDSNASTPGTRKLRELTRNLRVPELMNVPKDHILRRSFYLLDEFPGRYAGGKLWVEKEPSARHDAVTSVVIGSNDWAAAWSKDGGDRARYAPEPGGEGQREMAYRFGVNIVMVALTGNYKADQVHVPYILERIGK